MKRKKTNIPYRIAVIVMVCFVAVFAYFAFDMFVYASNAQTSRENATAMQNIFAEQLEVSPGLGGQSELSRLFHNARERTGNPDIVAFLHIEGTNISDAVVQGGDNDFYLTHDVHRQSNRNGALFLDFQNSLGFTDRSSIIYGHNVNNGTMFHDLRFFLDAEYFAANRLITLVTEENTLTYEVFAAFYTHVDFDYIQVSFADDADFLRLTGELIRRSDHDAGISIGADDRILILSTCTNTSWDMRYVVAAVLLG